MALRGPRELAGIERVMVIDDGRPVAAQQITCRSCGSVGVILNSKGTGALPPEMLAKKFMQLGWDFHKKRCPDCIARRHRQKQRESQEVPSVPFLNIVQPAASSQLQMKETAMAEPVRELSQLATAVEPDRATKRRINEAIGAVWDDSTNRYLGNNSDQQIATDLKVPRLWVENIRCEFYGDTGENADIADLRRDLDASISEAEQLTASSLKLAEKYETMAGDLKGIRRRLEKIEASVLPRR